VFYSRVKGELEDAACDGLADLCLLRHPSSLATQESRPLERLGEALLRFGPATYRPVGPADCGAMIATDGVSRAVSPSSSPAISPAAVS